MGLQRRIAPVAGALAVLGLFACSSGGQTNVVPSSCPTPRAAAPTAKIVYPSNGSSGITTTPGRIVVSVFFNEVTLSETNVVLTPLATAPPSPGPTASPLPGATASPAPVSTASPSPGTIVGAPLIPDLQQLPFPNDPPLPYSTQNYASAIPALASATTYQIILQSQPDANCAPVFSEAIGSFTTI
jgi:hypothetical protein